MILLRRILAVVVAALLAAAVSLQANAAAGLADVTKAPLAAAPAGERMCGACDDETMDVDVCAAICTGLVGLLPDETVGGAQRCTSCPASLAVTPHGRVSPPATAPPNTLLN